MTYIHWFKLAVYRYLVDLKTLILRRTFIGPLFSRIVTNLFQQLYCAFAEKTFANTYWQGVLTLKCPFDLWVYQEIIHDLQPDVIVETGTYEGGSALFLANMCDLVGNGRIITIDIETNNRRPIHQRITYIHGNSTSPEIINEVRQHVAKANTILVILDSAHEKDHVLSELVNYSPFVTVGSYLIVEDTQLNGNPIRPEFGPGPMEAVVEFLQQSSDFVIDRSQEKHFATFNPKGYLKRV